MTEISTAPESRYQEFPAAGSLRDNLNLDRRQLSERLRGAQGTVYCYIVRTVQRVNGCFAQTGSAPNFQGNRLTLATCKWSMRVAKAHAEEWQGAWIAGLTGAHVGGPDGNYLFFLMRVGHQFASQRDLWQWFADHLPEALDAKAADRHRLGDLYRPIDFAGAPNDPNTYATPRQDHVHRENDYWHRDIAYQLYGRWPTLLVGDPADSYLWSEPLIRMPFHVGRGYQVKDMAALLG